jgi:hypothetical protein
VKQRTRLQVTLGCLGGLLVGSTALAQQDPRAVVVRPSAAKVGSTRSAQRGAPTAKRYWADYAGKAIKRSDLDGSNVEVMVAETEGPYGVSHDPATDSILWTSASDQVVQMAPASGSGETLTLNSSFAENFAIVINGTERNLAYGVENGQVIRITQDRNTGAEQRDVLLTLSSPSQVHGLALSPDNTALYLGDTAGRMTQKLIIATRQVQQLVYDNSAPAAASSPAPASQPAPSSTEKSR